MELPVEAFVDTIRPLPYHPSNANPTDVTEVFVKASYFACMGYANRHDFPPDWPVPAAHQDPETTTRSYDEGMAECELAEAVGFDWISLSEHHYSGNRMTPNPAVMAGAVSQRCTRAKIALLGQLLPIINPVRAAEEIGMLDNLTRGRLVVAFMRGVISEDQVYNLNPAEGRERLTEGMDLIIRALTEPQPFSWEGRHYRYRTVSVWPKPVQQPMPPVIVATRSEDAFRYAAEHRLGIGVSYDSVEDTAGVTDRYVELCREAGWEPSSEQIVYRGGICLGETDEEAQSLLESLEARGVQRGLAVGANLTRAIQSARAGEAFDGQRVFGGDPAVRGGRGLRGMVGFVGSPETVAKQLQAFHDRCGVGVVDLGFQQPGIPHERVMREIDLFGREVLPRMREF